MRTLADMTEEERDACRGMWCEEKDGSMCIYMGADATPEQTGVFAYPASAIPMRVFLNRITPRPDLPRAWNPNGTPVKGSWTEAEYIGDSHGMRDVYHFDGTPTHRYFQTEWEEIPNV